MILADSLIVLKSQRNSVNIPPLSSIRVRVYNCCRNKLKPRFLNIGSERIEELCIVRF